MDDGRGFTLSHQRVSLDIDFSGVITATAHLTILPTSPNLRTLNLHASPLLQISNVYLSSPTPIDPLLSTPASYALCQPFQPLPQRDPPIQIRSHTEIKRKTWAAVHERDEGELAISVTGGWVRLLEGDTALAPIEIQVDYRLAIGGEVVEGIVFDGDAVYLSPTAYDSARIWTPCLDSLWDRCTWEIEFIVSATIDGTATMVVSSGELLEQVTHPFSPSKTIFYYLQTTPTSVQHVGFAAGPFEPHVIAETPKPILGFCLPGDLDILVNSTTSLARAMNFYSTEFGSYPFSEFKAVFVRNSRALASTSATMSILSADLLYPADIIDQALPTRQTLSLALAQQWIGINVIQRTLADTWLIHGLALYLNSLFLRHVLGNNEYRFRLKKDIERCVHLDQGDKWPICMPGCLDPPDIAFINIKAPLVLHILDRHLTKAGTSLGLSRVIPRIFLAALSDELSGNTLSTQFFFKTCRKVSGLDLQPFQDQWVLGSGCPVFRLYTNFIRKKFTVELYMTQVIRATGKRATALFEGGLTVRIHEADGAPFEHVVDIKSMQKTYNLPFNTKYKRTRRSGHIAARFRKLQQDLAAEDDQEEAQPKTAEAFAYAPWEEEEERKRWKVAEWSDEQVEIMMGEGGGYEWIRIDPDCEWLASFEFSEKPWYWISQLQSDRDVAAQLEAIQNMAHNPSPVVASELVKTIMVKNYFYRIRMEAARALVNYSSAESEYIGLFYLLKAFQTLFSDNSSDPLDAEFPVKRNDFSDFTLYFLKKAIITALSNLRDPISRTSWPNVRKFLLALLQTNDNTNNSYSDAYYVATIVSAMGNALSASDRNDEKDQLLLRDASEALQRVVTMDRLVPSFQNVVTQAGLKTQLKLIMAGQVTNDARLFLSYTREGNYEPLRQLAFDGLLISRPPGRTVALVTYLTQVVRNDSSLNARRHVSRALSEGILMSLAFGDVPGTSAPGIVDVTMDSEQARIERSEQHDRNVVKVVRKEFGKRAELRDAVQAEFLSSFTAPDHDLRFALIKLAEIITSASEEPLAGSNVPMLDVPAVTTPKIRINIGGPKDEYFPEATAPFKLVLNPPVKAKPVRKSQSNGLSDGERLAIETALDKLMAHKTSIWFRRPVDPIRDSAPSYLTIIKKPMDLSSARAKLAAGDYSSKQDFIDDIHLITENCKLYNVDGSDVYRMCEAFETFFHKIWTKIEATLNNSAASRAQAEDASWTRPVPESPAPPAPLPPVPVKLKLKTAKSVSIDASPQVVAPMGPPPVPAHKNKPVPVPAESKKRKPVSVALDDMLGAEVDAMDRDHHPDSFERMLEPKPKKQKLPKASPEPSFKEPTTTVSSPEKKKKSKESKESAVLPPAVPTVPAASIRHAPPQPPPDLPPTKSNSMPFKLRRARHLVGILQKEPAASIFLIPVDPILHGCPTYLDEIKEPMDLGTIQTKIEEKRYKTMGKLAYDIELIFANCRQFNNYGDVLVEAADALEAVYWREWPKAVSPRLTSSEKKDLATLLAKAIKDPISLFFRVAVDPEALGIPNYFEIIAVEDARDLSLIRRKLERGDYTTARQVDDDISLMLENAKVFNGEGPVVDAANAFDRWWRTQKARLD